MQQRAVDLNEVLAGLTPMLTLLVGEDVKVRMEPDPKLWAALTDRSQFEQVILNLAVNARDAMPGGGCLTISTSNVHLERRVRANARGRGRGPARETRHLGHGAGMTPEVLSHAFEPFFTTKERGKGTGLGLSTVIGVVQQSGGSVDVVSDAGHRHRVHDPPAAGRRRRGQGRGDGPEPADAGRSGDDSRGRGRAGGPGLRRTRSEPRRLPSLRGCQRSRSARSWLDAAASGPALHRHGDAGHDRPRAGVSTRDDATQACGLCSRRAIRTTPCNTGSVKTAVRRTSANRSPPTAC
jgi:hypothetical protein